MPSFLLTALLSGSWHLSSSVRDKPSNCLQTHSERAMHNSFSQDVNPSGPFCEELGLWHQMGQGSGSDLPPHAGHKAFVSPYCLFAKAGTKAAKLRQDDVPLGPPSRLLL